MATAKCSTNSTQLIPFSFGDQQIRIIMQGNDPWFIASDICTTLDIANHRDAVARLDDDEKGVVSTDTPGGKQDMLAINESGLYVLAFGSRKPEAKVFRRWIAHDVIPSIRKTGTYSTKQQRAVDHVILQHRRAKEITSAYLGMAKLFGTDEPMARAIAADAVQHQTGLNVQPLLAGNVVAEVPMKPTELGKLIGLSARKVNALLALQGFQLKHADSGDWVPTSKGDAYATCHPYKSPHSSHCGHRTLWYRTIVDVLDVGPSARDDAELIAEVQNLLMPIEELRT